MRKFRQLQPLRDTVHDMTIGIKMQQDERLKRGNFTFELVKAFPDIDDDMDTDINGVHPDYYRIDEEERTVYVYEVEDHCKLSDCKLGNYGNLWMDFDCFYITLILTSYDRYGNNESVINLHDIFYYNLKAQRGNAVPHDLNLLHIS